MTNFCGIGGRPGPTLNPGQAQREGVMNREEGAMGDAGMERGAAGVNVGGGGGTSHGGRLTRQILEALTGAEDGEETTVHLKHDSAF